MAFQLHSSVSGDSSIESSDDLGPCRVIMNDNDKSGSLLNTTGLLFRSLG